jgi:hypothetical protein
MEPQEPSGKMRAVDGRVNQNDCLLTTIDQQSGIIFQLMKRMLEAGLIDSSAINLPAINVDLGGRAQCRRGEQFYEVRCVPKNMGS